MNETLKITLFFGVAPIIIATTFQVWSTFKSTDKNKEAKISLIVGVLILVLFSIVALYLLGSLNKPIQSITEILQINVDLRILIFWTLAVSFAPKIANKIVPVFVRKGKAINSSRKQIPTKTNTKKVVAIFKDPLNKDLANWHTIVGQPQISNIRGTPNPPSLLLEENASDPRNSFIITDKVNIQNGKIMCDVYLEQGAVFNLVFRANNSVSDYYMARVDARSNGSNGILSATGSTSWGYIKQTNTYVLNDRWYRVELMFRNSKIEFKINNEVISVEDNKIITTGSVGMFNELKRVFVNNFVASRA